ncbi:MAG: ASCH domain-containing protein [Polyangiales bacterium]
MTNARRRLSKLPEVPLLRLKPSEPYRVLSIIQPWAWGVIFAGKDVENRAWRTHYRGRVLIHASSKRRSRAEMAAHRRMLARLAQVDLKEIPEDYGFSQILGSVELVDCGEGIESRWSQEGFFHWTLRDQRRLAKPIAGVTGTHRLWQWTL